MSLLTKCRFVPAMLVLPLSLFSSHTQAACSRVINAPVTSLGFSVIVNGDSVTGIYPDIFRSLSSKETCQFQFSAVPRARLEVTYDPELVDAAALRDAFEAPVHDAATGEYLFGLYEVIEMDGVKIASESE